MSHPLFRHIVSRYLTGISLLMYSMVLSGQQSIIQVRGLPVGSVVTTTGTITTGPEFGLLRYMQDDEAGMALYDEDISSVLPGDSLVVTGVISEYRGELQLSPVFSFQVVNSGKQTTALIIDNFQQLSQSQFEAREIVMACAGIQSCEPTLSAGWYEVFDQYGNIARLWIAEDHPVEGFPILDQPVTIKGIWTAFEDQYQLLCQDISDASEGTCHYISPPELFFTDEAPLISWDPIPYAGTYVVISEGDLDLLYDFGFWGLNAQLIPQDLEPGKLYTARLVQQDTSGTFFSSTPVFFSPPSTDKSIEILFNRSIDNSFSDGSKPLATGSSVIETDLIQRIDNVTSTLDVMMYNTGRSSIVQAINRAVQRGVNVRYIADDETSNSALEGTLTFPVRFRGGTGIMHNKVVIGDAEDADRAWVWAGSTNLTSNQLTTDPNHAYVIPDQAMARSYTMEFEEMWGDISGVSRYGDFKTNNTAHLFKVGDALIESYFSPSDDTNCQLIEALRTADHQALIGLLLLTKEDLVEEIITLHQAGKEVRVILEDEESSSEAVMKLNQAGVQFVVHDPSSIFHHKYAIIDEGYLDSDPQVITGSHNWTWSADNINDENTLIIHDQSIANIFRQEYEARWRELNPLAVGDAEVIDLSVYPNPASSHIQLENPRAMTCLVKLINIHGQIVDQLLLLANEHKLHSLKADIPSGVYVMRFNWLDQRVDSRVLVKT